MRKKEMAKQLQQLQMRYDHYERMAHARFRVISLKAGVLQDCSLHDLYIMRHRNGPGSATSKEFWINGPMRYEVTEK